MSSYLRKDYQTSDFIVQFTNCLLPINGKLFASDLLVNSTTGLIVSPQDLFYNSRVTPNSTIDLGGRMLSPGFIDVQINGAFGFDFSDVSKGEKAYRDGFENISRRLVQTGVTSFLPTITSQKNHVYEKV